jgi:hypothetical protein
MWRYYFVWNNIIDIINEDFFVQWTYSMEKLPVA